MELVYHYYFLYRIVCLAVSYSYSSCCVCSSLHSVFIHFVKRVYQHRVQLASLLVNIVSNIFTSFDCYIKQSSRLLVLRSLRPTYFMRKIHCQRYLDGPRLIPFLSDTLSFLSSHFATRLCAKVNYLTLIFICQVKLFFCYC